MSNAAVAASKLALLRNRLAPGSAEDSLPWLQSRLYFSHVASRGSEWRELDDILGRFSDRPPLALVESKGERFAVWPIEIGEAMLEVPLRRNTGGEPFDESSREVLDAIHTVAQDTFSSSGDGYMKLDYCTPLAGDATVLEYNQHAQPLDRYWLRQLANLHRIPTGRKLADLNLTIEGVEAARFIFEDLSEGEVGLIVGPSKAGKTWLLCDVALSVASGKDALDGLLKVHRGGNVACIFMEESIEQIAARVNAIGRRRGLSRDDLEVYCRDEFVGPNGRAMTVDERKDKIVDICDRLVSPRVIIIDNAKEILDGSANNDSDVSELLEFVRSISWRNRCVVLMAHHVNEASIKAGVKAVLQSTATLGHGNYGAYARWQFNIAKLGQKDQMAIKCRVVSANHGAEWPEPKTLVMAKDKAGWPSGFALPETTKDSAPDTLHAAVAAVKALKVKVAKRATADSIKGVLGLSRPAAEALITKAIAAGVLVEARGDGSRAKIVQLPENLAGQTALGCQGQQVLTTDMTVQINQLNEN